MNHMKNAIEIVADAPMTASDFADCYTVLPRYDCYLLLSFLAGAGILRCDFDGVYAV